MALTRLTLLQRIFDNFQSATQWPDAYGSKYFERAEGLIEVVEIADCGSIGGHDRSNPNKRVTGDGLYDRFLTLLRKEQNATRIKSGCGADVNTLAHYFTELHALRSKVYNEFPA